MYDFLELLNGADITIFYVFSLVVVLVTHTMEPIEDQDNQEVGVEVVESIEADETSKKGQSSQVPEASAPTVVQPLRALSRLIETNRHKLMNSLLHLRQRKSLKLLKLPDMFK